MNPVPLFLLAISLPLLLGGCGEKESVGEVKPVEEKVLEVKEEVKPEEPVAETKPELEGVNEEEIEEREGIAYLKGSDTPYTGKAYGLHENGQKEKEINYKDGKKEGLATFWHENGQKFSETNYKDGEPDGPVVWWHYNGKKWWEKNWKDGKLVGLAVAWHENGQKEYEANYKDGKAIGLAVGWHKNGNMMSEKNWKDGEKISEKWWNSKGELVDSFEEARK